MNEGYPSNWRHSIIHLNPETGEMHSDCIPSGGSVGEDGGDHFVRYWIEKNLSEKNALLKRWLKVIREPHTEDVLALERETAESVGETEAGPARG